MPHRNDSLPIDGIGGALWNTPFTVPVYYPDGNDETGTFVQLSWHLFNNASTHIAQMTAVFSVSFGIVLITGLLVLALTPSSKRGLPLFTFYLLALFFETLRLLPNMILWSHSGYGTIYYQLMQDPDTTQFVAGTLTMLILGQLASCFAFLFIQFCFFLQARAVLSSLKMSRPKWYVAIFTYLIFLGTLAFLWRLMFAIWTAVADVPLGMIYPNWVWYTCDILYAASIGSWSLVFSVQVAMIIIKRVRLGGALKRDEALNILLLMGIESFLLPVLACALGLTTYSWLPQPEILIMVSVIFTLPFGTLWASAMQAYDYRQNTFTLPANNVQQPPPIETPDSKASDTPATPNTLVDRAPAVHSPQSSSLPMYNLGPYTHKKSNATSSKPSQAVAAYTPTTAAFASASAFSTRSRTNSTATDASPLSQGLGPSRTPPVPTGPKPMGALDQMIYDDEMNENAEAGNVSSASLYQPARQLPLHILKKYGADLDPSRSGVFPRARAVTEMTGSATSADDQKVLRVPAERI